MFEYFRRRRRAREVATGIGQLINALSVALESMGPKAPEKLIRGLASKCRDDPNIGETRVLCALVPMTDNVELPVTLMIYADGRQRIAVDGDRQYAGFSLTCGIPPGAVLINLQSGATYTVSTDARRLYAECKTMPNVVEGEF